LDPQLAMAYWGQALVLGPNINAAMDPNSEQPALELIKKAVELKANTTPREQAYIDALAERYSGNASDRKARDQAYAEAMRKVHERFPDDLDAATLYAEASMDLRPWGYWSRDGQPYEGVAEVVDVVEKVIARNPQHPGALHLYIHLMESTEKVDKAEPVADRLLTLMPAAGHMVHMPAHIYQRVGRYADAAKRLHHAVSCAGSIPNGLLPPQHSFPLVRRQLRRPQQVGSGVSSQGSFEDSRRGLKTDSASGDISRSSLLRANSFWKMG
jgi:tetratricopeptide (TPR) repeat protein